MSGMKARLNRRSFLELTVGTTAAAVAFGAAPSLMKTGTASAQVADVPREMTMILVGTGGESPNQFTDIENINPMLSGTGAVSRSGYQTVYEPLWYYNMLTGAEQPWLAESFEYNADFTQVSVKLRAGIAWSDGTPITSDDVKYSFETQRDTAGLSHSADMKRWIKEVTVVDASNFTFVLNDPNPRFFFEYCAYHSDMGVFIVPKHIFEGQDPVSFTNYAADGSLPVVSGPYKLVATSAEQKIWDRHDDWWAATTGFHALPEPLRLIFLPGFKEDKMAQMVIANEADITLNISPATMPTLWEQNPKITTHSGHDKPYGYTDWWPSGLGFNCTTAPWDDPEMRWAISYMIDRPQLVEFGYKGAGEPTMLPYPKYAPLMTYVDKAKENLLVEFDTNLFDLAKADGILTGKGYAKDGDGHYAKDGAKLSMVITTFDVFADLAPFVTEQLQKAGVDASFVLPPTFFTDLTTGAAPAYIWGHGGSVKDPYMTMHLYHQDFVKPNGEATYPFYRWANPEYDAVVDSMGKLADTDPSLMDLFLQGTEIWLKNLPDVPLLQFYHRIPMNETYWTNWPMAGNEYINGAFWHRTCLLIILGVKSVTAA